MNDEELEQVFRAGLHGAARQAGNQQALADQARARLRQRQNRRAGAAAVAVLAVIVPVAIVVSHGQSPDRPTDNLANPATTTPAVGSTPVPEGWRVESYDGVELRVPPDWAWGASPTQVPDDASEIYSCGPGAGTETSPGPDGAPYVGRPVSLSDVCIGGVPSHPGAAYVWFDSPLEAGVEDLSGAFVRQTVAVGAMTVSVADDDPEELATIIGSVKSMMVDSNGCASDVGFLGTERTPHVPGVTTPLDQVGAVKAVAVCDYVNTEVPAGPVSMLEYSTLLDGANAEPVVDALLSSPVVTVLGCDPSRLTELSTVLLHVDGTDADATVVAHLGGCYSGYRTAGAMLGLTRDNVKTWAVDGVGVYAYGPPELDGLLVPLIG